MTKKIENVNVESPAIAETFTIANLAKEHGICPKRARARLRKIKGKLIENPGMTNWTFPVARRDEMLTIIQGKKTEDESEDKESES